MEAKNGSLVKVHYTGKINDEVFDSSEGKEPLMFKVGDHKVIKGFEDAIIGMKKDDKKSVNIPKEEAYGVRDEKLVSEVPKSQLGDLSSKVELKAGVSFQLKDQMGNVAIATVTEVKDESIVLDLNHPLAGKDLTFELEVVEVMEAKNSKDCCEDSCDKKDDNCDCC